MLSSVRNFFYRHRRKFIISGILIGGTMFATRYAQRKFIEWQERQAKEFLERTRKLQHFESTERTCNRTIINLSNGLKAEILKASDVRKHLDKIRNGKGNKIKMWEELEILVFSQHSALLYSGLMLIVALKVQLNILGGYMCREHSETECKIKQSDQNKYLGLCQYFIQEGCVKLCALIRNCVEQVLSDYPLKKTLCIKDIEEIFWSIQTNLSNDPKDPMKNISSYVLPPTEELGPMDDVFNKMVTETYQVFETDEVVSLLNSCLSSGYSNTLDKLAEQLSPENLPSTSKTASTTNGHIVYTDINKKKLPMAKVIPLLHKILEDMVTVDNCGPWINQFLNMERVKNFGANIYEAFSYSV